MSQPPVLLVRYVLDDIWLYPGWRTLSGNLDLVSNSHSLAVAVVAAQPLAGTGVDGVLELRHCSRGEYDIVWRVLRDCWAALILRKVGVAGLNPGLEEARSSTLLILEPSR